MGQATPTFRTDLKCVREEQQGVVFYRIDDPDSDASFRLYEIEYLVAQKFDGSRNSSEVAAAVKDEHNFDISVEDVEKFVSRLESMGFVAANIDQDNFLSATADQDEIETQVMSVADTQTFDLLADVAETEVDQAEFARLLKSAMLHVKQGFLVHAKDYLLAAKEMKPKDEGLGKLLNHLGILGDSVAGQELDRLWQEAMELYPEVLAEVGPLNTPEELPEENSVAESAFAVEEAWEVDLKSRVLGSVMVLLIVLAMIGGAFWAYRSGWIFKATPEVTVAAVDVIDYPVYSDPAKRILPASRTWLSPLLEVQVAKVHKRSGETVSAGELIAEFVKPPKLKKPYDTAAKALKNSENAAKKAQAAVDRLVAKRSKLEAQAKTIAGKLKKLKPKGVRRGGGISKRELQKLKKQKVKLNRALSQLAKKLRKPKAKLKKAEANLKKSQARFDAQARKSKPYELRAKDAGTVSAVLLKPGEAFPKGAQAVQVVSRGSLELVFLSELDKSIQKGGVVYLSVANEKPIEAKLRLRQKGEVTVDVEDPKGTLSERAAKEFRLVERYIPGAARVPKGAVIKNDQDEARVLLVTNDIVLHRPVTIAGDEGEHFIVQAKEVPLRQGQRVALVTPILDLQTLQDGEKVKVEARP